MDKTVTVLVERRVKHPLYGKVVTRSAKYHAHDETNEFKEGDLVEIEATRKLTKTKAWRVVAGAGEGAARSESGLHGTSGVAPGWMAACASPALPAIMFGIRLPRTAVRRGVQGCRVARVDPRTAASRRRARSRDPKLAASACSRYAGVGPAG